MTPVDQAGPLDWRSLRLVAFDVDGTLYRQRPVRLRMARDLLFDAVGQRSTETFRILKAYREIRERLGDDEVPDFDRPLVEQAARQSGTSAQRVRERVAEWIERRPLPYVAAARYAGLDALFAGLRRHGKIIGILSDYPVPAKLSAMNLAADHIVSAGDAGVGRLKPHPLGLQTLMAAAAVQPAETLLIGDRVERDGLAARRAGAAALIRSSSPIAGWRTFARYDDPLFAPVLA